MTQRLFDDAPLLGRITANITQLTPCKEGVLAVLDRTIFFPRGGGQPCDGGTIGGAQVLDVYEQQGQICHLLDRQPDQTQGVECQICLENRLDHMQHHTGQHIISAAAWQLFQNPTLIARIEQPACHIEFANPMDQQQLRQLWLRVNEITAQALPVRCQYYTPEQAASMPVRGKITPHEQIRLVEIQGFDLNACGGSHCPDTSLVGQLRWYGTKQVRGAFRLYFLAGSRAARYSLEQDLQAVRLGQLAQQESPEQTEQQIDQLFLRAPQLEQDNARLRRQLLEAMEANLLAEAQSKPEAPAIFRLLEDWEVRDARILCENLTHHHAILVILAIRHQGKLTVLAAQKKGMDKLKLNQWLQPFLAQWGGKGGGSPVMAQGAVEDCSQALEQFQALARRMEAALAE